MKEKGILLPIFSLPSKYGIGDFGYEAYEFIDILSENKIDYWEILPINACKGLPYSPISYYALEESYISLDKLKDEGLIKAARKRNSEDRILNSKFKEKYFQEAFNNLKKNDEYKEFARNKEIKKYCTYMSKKTKKSEEYYSFLQYIAFKQWMDLKIYANSKGIKIIGDMPAYPPFDSAETEYNTEYYDYEFEAGTPPDYFNENGQRWGSYVYNIKNIKKDKFKYLVDRYKYYLKLFDKVRVDYFRGYDSFFKIPIGKTGREGYYCDGVSYGFFNELFKDSNIKVDNLIIEDLGDIREETVKLREYYGFTRQKILQFSLDLDNLYDRDNDNENVLVFPGNHDCQTIRSWYDSFNDYYKSKLKEFLRKNECNDENINIGIIEYCNKCKAKLVVVTIQDILGLDDSCRINIPGIESDNNWSWKLINFEELKEKIKYL